jgi:hypothetical protein
MALWQATEPLIDEAMPPRSRAYAWYEAALLLYRRPALASRAAARAVEAVEPLGDRLALYRTLARLAITEPAPERSAVALERMRAQEDARWPARVLRQGANAEHVVALAADRFDDAVHWARRQVALEGEDGDWEFTGLANLANSELATGHIAAAIEVGERLVARLRGTRWEDSLALSRLNLVAALLAAGDAARARPLAAEGWAQAARFDLRPYWADYLALLAALEGRAAEAAQIAGYADAAYAALDGEREVNEARSIERATALAHQALGDEAVDRLVQQGRALPDEAITRLLFA